MLDLKSGAEISKLIVEERSVGVSHIASPDILLCITDITHEVIYEGGWHYFHEPADWDGQYFDRKKEMNLLSGKSKRWEA